jgi:hypothetical protein
VREPTPDEERLMIIGGFDTLAEYHQWLRTPTDPAEIAKLDEALEEEHLLMELLEASDLEEDEEEM